MTTPHRWAGMVSQEEEPAAGEIREAEPGLAAEHGIHKDSRASLVNKAANGTRTTAPCRSPSQPPDRAAFGAHCDPEGTGVGEPRSVPSSCYPAALMPPTELFLAPRQCPHAPCPPGSPILML